MRLFAAGFEYSCCCTNMSAGTHVGVHYPGCFIAIES